MLTLVMPEDQASPLFDELWQEIRVFEATFSRFLPDSELTYVNQRAGIATEVSPEFIALASAARDYSRRTEGLYNPFVLPKLQAAGYKNSWLNPDVQEPGTDFSNRAIVQAEKLEIGKTWVKIPSQAALDFGGIGKGYLLDELVKLLPKQGIEGYWFSLGGDIACGGFDNEQAPWQIGIQQADGHDTVANIVNAKGENLAIATSGTTKRKGEGWHHIIDPRSGHSATTDVLTATVQAGSGTQADVLAKCLVIAGTQQLDSFARRHKITDYLVQAEDNKGDITLIRSGAF